ncbi:MAG: choice-of-anchor Q domain-containing protein [Pyrinomonadaceae bacterium]
MVLDAIRYVGDTDQRGFARVFGGTIDIGAFESNFTTPTPTPTPNPTVSPTPSPTPTPTPVCTYSLGTTGQTFTYTGGSGLIDVITQSGYAYTATNNDPFVTLSKSSGTGNGTINEDLLSSQLSE